jgi:uncharacterized protein (TIGR02145 family)
VHAVLNHNNQWAYGGNESIVNTYGRYYTWYAVADSRNLCPTGWHVPNDDEWTTLITYLGGNGIAGGKLKETGTAHWKTSNTGATNESGFTALPDGYHNYLGGYSVWGDISSWWSSTEYSTTSTSYCFIENKSRSIGGSGRFFFPKQTGFGVRCLRD